MLIGLSIPVFTITTQPSTVDCKPPAVDKSIRLEVLAETHWIIPIKIRLNREFDRLWLLSANCRGSLTCRPRRAIDIFDKIKYCFIMVRRRLLNYLETVGRRTWLSSNPGRPPWRTRMEIGAKGGPAGSPGRRVDRGSGVLARHGSARTVPLAEKSRRAAFSGRRVPQTNCSPGSTVPTSCRALPPPALSWWWPWPCAPSPIAG